MSTTAMNKLPFREKRWTGRHDQCLRHAILQAYYSQAHHLLHHMFHTQFIVESIANIPLLAHSMDPAALAPPADGDGANTFIFPLFQWSNTQSGIYEQCTVNPTNLPPHQGPCIFGGTLPHADAASWLSPLSE
jgi:hypothetical protein